MTSSSQQLAPALDSDARLAEIERSLNLLLNVTPVNAAEAWADFERSDFGTVPTLRLRPLEFEPDLVRRDLYHLEIEDVTDPALHILFRTKRDEIARQITTLEDRDTSPWVRPRWLDVPGLRSASTGSVLACRSPTCTKER
jgi:hypothetical protein